MEETKKFIKLLKTDLTDFDYYSQKRLELSVLRSYLGEEYANAIQIQAKAYQLNKEVKEKDKKKFSVAELDREIEETDEYRKTKEIKYLIQSVDQVLNAIKSRIDTLMVEYKETKE